MTNRPIFVFPGTNPWDLEESTISAHVHKLNETFFPGFSAEACTPAVLAKRGSVFMSEGNTLSLSCTVQHCESTWAGKWKWEKSIDSNSSIVRDSPRHHLMEKTPKASEIQLLLEVQRVEPADMGAYRCSVQWADGSTELGHWTYVNITRGKQCNIEECWLFSSRILINSCTFCPPFQWFPLKEKSCTGFWFGLAPPFVCLSFWGWPDVWVQRSSLSLNTGCRLYMPKWTKINPTSLLGLHLDARILRKAGLRLSKVSIIIVIQCHTTC